MDHPVDCFQSGTGKNGTTTRLDDVAELAIKCGHPTAAVLVLEWMARTHLGNVFRGVVLVSLHELAAQPSRHELAHGGLSATGDAHDHDDFRGLVHQDSGMISLHDS